MIGRRRGPFPSLVLACLLAPAGLAQTPGPGEALLAPFGAEELIRAVVRAQKRADAAVTASTFDQVEVQTDYGKDGRPKSVKRRRYQYFSGDEPGEGTRELLEVDGRPATPEEKRKDAEELAKQQKRQKEREAEARAARPPAERGDGDDPLVGPRRLSDLIARFSYGPVEELEVDGRPAYAVRFSPKPGSPADSAGDRALNALAGHAVVDAADLQVVSAEARLVAPVKIGGGLVATLKSATLSYRALRVGEGAWLPCVVDVRAKGRAALLVRIDSSSRFEFSGYARYSVEVESSVGGPGGPSVQSAP